MKLAILFFILSLTLKDVYAQLETRNWAISPNATLQFNSGSVSLIPNSTLTDFHESSSCISDVNGNLILYSDGETVWGADNSILPNGNNIAPVTINNVRTCTQGSLFLKKPKSNNIYYLFSLGLGQKALTKTLSYSVIDMNLNAGIGSVISNKNILINDTLSEKMTATNHCNHKDKWLVVVKYIKLSNVNTESSLNNYKIEFLSYLITADGVQYAPIKSPIDIICSDFGQMKFNNAGNELAIAEPDQLILFSFDNSTGIVNLKENIPLSLGNGYGLEYSPNDSLIYINEKQYNFQNGGLISLLNYNCPTQIQRGLDNKLYARYLPQNEIFLSSYLPNDVNSNGQWFYTGNNDNISHISVIDLPNNYGISCNMNFEFYDVFSIGNYQNYISLPNFPSYRFNHKPSEFGYTGTCSSEIFDFFLNNNPTVDSVSWYFHDTATEEQGINTQHLYTVSGEYQVTCTVYQNGVETTSTQCVNVCGQNDVNIPNSIDLCYSVPQEVNALNSCSATYLWNTGDTTSAIFLSEEGTYILETTNSCGNFLDTINVFKSDDCNLLTEIPNIITSNNDGVNDIFSIKVKNAKSFTYSIINRWGNELLSNQIQINSYLSWNTFNLWDGKTLDGKIVSEGTYFYVFNFELVNGSHTSQNGFIQVEY